MSDLNKSRMLRAFLWVVAVPFVAVGVFLVNRAVDKLPIWFSDAPHFIVESGVFWATVGSAIWRWLSERVWVGRQAPEAQP